MDYDDLLDDAMSAFDEPEDGIEGKSVETIDHYGWALKAVAGKKAALTDAYTQRRTTLDTAFAEEAEKLDKQTAHLKAILERWLLAWNAADPKKKSHNLPCGVKVRSTAGAVDLVIEDKAKYEAFMLESFPALGKTVTTLSTGDAKKLLVDFNTNDVDENGKKLVDGKQLKNVSGLVASPDGDTIPFATLIKKPRTVTVTI